MQTCTARMGDTTTPATSAAASLSIGLNCLIVGLNSRADLNGVEVRLVELQGDRWATRVKSSGEGVRVKPANLVAIPGLLERELPVVLLREILGRCEPSALIAVTQTCRSLRGVALMVLHSSSYRRRLDAHALARWSMSRSIHGFVSLDTFQRHRPDPVGAGRVSTADGTRVAHVASMGQGVPPGTSDHTMRSFPPHPAPLPLLTFGACMPPPQARCGTLPAARWCALSRRQFFKGLMG